jgi:hypothetical protein
VRSASAKSEGKIDQTKKAMEEQGEKVMKMQRELQAKAASAAQEAMRAAQRGEPADE